MPRSPKWRQLPKGEIKRRIKADGGYLKEKFTELGLRALCNVANGGDWRKISEHIQVLRSVWLDKDGDLLTPDFIHLYCVKHGIKDKQVEVGVDSIIALFEKQYDRFPRLFQYNGKTPQRGVYEE
jgi:hypothetical protein